MPPSNPLAEASLTPTYRNKLLGMLADSVQGVSDFAGKPFGYDNPPARMLMDALGVPGLATTLDRASYGERLTQGSGQTLQLRPETLDAGLALAPVAGAVGKVAPRAVAAAARNAAIPSDMAMQGQRGAITLGDEWAGKGSPSIEKLARNGDKFLYHSSVADELPNLKYGIEPGHGPWIQEVASGATDDAASLLENATPLAWLSDQPDWVAMKVARKLGKPVSDVTPQDIEQHGHLAIVSRKSPSADETYYVGNEGLNNGGYSQVQNLRGESIPAHNTPLYGESSNYQPMEPFGVERNEYVSTKTVDPLLHLTGPELVEFLRLNGARQTVRERLRARLK